MSDISFVFFAISWGATIGLYVNHTHLHETKFQKIMVIILVISLVATQIISICVSISISISISTIN